MGEKRLMKKLKKERRALKEKKTMKEKKLIKAKKLEFEARKIKISIDYMRCEPAQKNTTSPRCGFACVKACRLYGRNILKIEGNRPVLAVADPEEIKRLDNECLSCEYHCGMQGTDCIQIKVPLPGIEEYRREVLGG
jgi:hypothetical protein